MPNNNVASFPFSPATDEILTVASDGAQSLLNGAIDNATTTIAVIDTSVFNAPCLFIIDDEVILASSVSDNKFLNCIRGFSNSTATAHSDKTPVSGFIFAYHHNQVAIEIESLGEFLFNSEFSGFNVTENLLAYSETFSNAAWAKTSDVTVPVDVSFLPNGSPATDLKEGSSLGNNMISATPVGLVEGETYSFSIYAKYNSVQWLLIGQNIAGTEERWAWFDIQNGVIGNIGIDAQALIVPVGNDWYRCVVVTACTADSYKAFDVCLSNADGVSSYLGTGINYTLISGAQVRSGGIDGSLTYITTNGSPISLNGNLILNEGDLSKSGISIQRRHGTAAQHNDFTGKLGEITVDTSAWVIRVHDGSTVGGFSLALQNHTHSNATQTMPGYMSFADKLKLDRISDKTIQYQTVQVDGIAQPQESTLNFTDNFTLTDDHAGNRTSVDTSDSGVGPGTYTKVTVNGKGVITGATLLSAGDIPNILSTQVGDFATAVKSTQLNEFAPPSSAVNINSFPLINVATPVNATDGVNKAYVDATATGLSFKQACRAASVSNVNISAPGTSLDAVSLNNGDRLLLKNQSDATQNGIYIFNGASSVLTRSLDANTSNDINPGMFLLVISGAVNADIGFVLSTSGAITLGTTNLTFVPFSSAGSVVAGNGIIVSGNTVAVKPVSKGGLTVSANGLDLATTGVTGGSYNLVTVDAYGRVIVGSIEDYQPASPNLTELAAVSLNGFITQIAPGVYAGRTIQPGTGITLVNGDGVADNVSIAVTPDSTLQKLQILQNGNLISTRQAINLIAGSGLIITEVDNPGANRADITIASSGTGEGAPTTSQYVTLATDTNLTNERVLVVATPLLLTDGGAGNNVTLGYETDYGSVSLPGIAIQLRRGTTANHSQFAGLLGEITVDTTLKTLRIHDGSTLGGTPLALHSHTHPVSQIIGVKYQTIQVAGTALPQQTNVDLSNLFLATDDVANGRTIITLADNNTSGAGQYGSSTQCPIITVNAEGLITSVKQMNIAGVVPGGIASGDLGGEFPGPSVVSVGGASAENIADTVTLVSARTNEKMPSTIVVRDASGNFSANLITANLVGDVSGNCAGTAATISGNLTGDVSSVGMVTKLSTSGVYAGTYGSGSQIPSITVDAKGRITKVALQTVSGTTPGGSANGDLGGNYPDPSVNMVGGQTAANIATGVTLALAGTNLPSPSSLVKRDGGGSAKFTTTTSVIHVTAYSPTPTFNLVLGDIQQITLTGNVTSSSLTGLVSGQQVIFDIVQDGVGGRSFVWPTNVFGVNASPGTGQAATGHNCQSFWCDGKNLYAISPMRTDLNS